MTFYEISRIEGDLGTYIYIAIADPRTRSTDEHEESLLLIRADASCVSLLDYEGVFYAVDDAAPDDVRAELRAARDAWSARWASGSVP